MRKNPEAPSLPRRLGRFLRRQWPLVVFTAITLGAHAFYLFCGKSSYDWRIGATGIVCSGVLLKKFHSERCWRIYLVPVFALFLFDFLSEFSSFILELRGFFLGKEYFSAQIGTACISAIASLPFVPFFFHKFSPVKAFLLIPLISFFMMLALTPLIGISFISYAGLMFLLGIATS